MVSVLRATNGFHARVVAARLGSEGIVTSLRGPCDGPYPMGDVEVLVHHADLEVAQEILLVDEIESAFPPQDTEVDFDDDGPDDDGGDASGPRSTWMLATALVVAAAFAVVRSAGY